MEQRLIAYAIPFFFVLIGVEVLSARALGRKVYRFHDAVSDLSCGITQQLSLIFMRTLLVLGYAAAYDHWHWLSLSATDWTSWTLAFVGVDFIYYWWHRLSHHVNVLWAAHVVHHQSEDYNLAVALRQSMLTSATGAPFYILLALLGVPPVVYATSHAINTLYQFWIHTELVRRVGPLEWVFNTPSHHRVHHGINPRYLDKNHGGILIIWDRLFGTFEPEDEPVVYGVVKPLNSFNAVWANVQPWVALWRLGKGASLADKLRLLLKPPAWRPGDTLVQAPEVSVDTYTKYDPPLTARARWLTLAEFCLVGGLTFFSLLFQAQWPLHALLAITGFVFATVVVWSARFRPPPAPAWSRALSLARWLLLPLALL